MSTNTDTEINEAVAIKLGARKIECRGPHDYYCDHWELTHGVGLSQRKFARNVPDYCHSIEAAWEVWNKMAKKYFLTLETEAGEFGRNIVKVWKNDGKGDHGWVIEDVYADTAPMAICLAFLKLP